MDEQQTGTLLFRRDDDFASLYANNIQFETSAWDFKIIFGQLDQRDNKSSVDQHTSITIPWPTAKLMAYFLAVNVLLHQRENGAINMPNSVIPARPGISNEALAPLGKDIVGYLAWIHDQFFSADPYIPPGVDLPKARPGSFISPL